MTTMNGTSGLADLVDMARECVKAGTIGNLDTPAILRQIARDHLGAGVPLAAQVDLLKPELLPKLGDLVVAECEVRLGVRGIWLTTATHNDRRLVALGAFERACHRTLVEVVRRFVRLVSTPILILPVPNSSGLVRPTSRQVEAPLLSLSGVADAVTLVRRPRGGGVLPRRGSGLAGSAGAIS